MKLESRQGATSGQRRHNLRCILAVIISIPLLLPGYVCGLTAEIAKNESAGPTLKQMPPGWKQLAKGLDFGVLETKRQGHAGDSKILILRIDPKAWDLEFAAASQKMGSMGQTARQWCAEKNFIAAINAGMFNRDYITHTGYLKMRNHINSGRKNAYQSVAAFHPTTAGLPQFKIFDLDDPDVSIDRIGRDYDSSVQNLRLIKRPGINKWGVQPKRWSEAALGEDKAGNVLFIFSRSPFSMHDFNEELLGLGIDLVAAQHLEGGPEAQLYIKIGSWELDAFGSYEAGSREGDDNSISWPIPNVLGIRQKK